MLYEILPFKSNFTGISSILKTYMILNDKAECRVHGQRRRRGFAVRSTYDSVREISRRTTQRETNVFGAPGKGGNA